MSTRWHTLNCFMLGMALCFTVAVAAEEPGAGYVPDPEIEKLIVAAVDPEKAVAFPAQKRLAELGTAAERALNFKLFAEKTTQARRPYAELIARCCAGRVGYRVTLELQPDGSGNLVLESDRTMLAECAQKSDRLNGKAARVFPEDELRRNPYSKVDLAKHITGAMKYNQGATLDSNGRILANGEVAFTNFDDFASFATSFDRAGYHMLNSIALFDNNDLRTLHFKKTPETDRLKAANFLLMFHDVKWEFVLDFKGQLKSQNASKITGNRAVWRFNCAQMLGGEAEIEASFNPLANPKVAGGTGKTETEPQNPAATQTPAGNAPVALLGKKTIHVLVGKRFDPSVEANPNGADTIAALDGSPSVLKDSELTCQWVQTGGVPLNQLKEKMTKPILRMRFYEVGRYTFELTVARNGVTSAPAEIEVIVDDPSSSAALAENNGGDGSSAISRRSELQPGKNTANMALASQNAPKNEMRVVQPAPLPPVPTPIAPVANRSEKTPNLPSKGILLDEIRREEADYYAKRGGRVVSVSTNPPPDLGEPPHADKAPSVVQTTDKPLSPAGQNAPPVPIKPALDKGTEVSIGRKIDLDGIRSEEEQFNRSRPIQKLPPEITPIQKGPDAAPGNNVKPPEVPDVRIDVPKPSASADDAIKAKMKALEEAKFAALKKERDDLAKAEAERVEAQKKQQAELARMEAARREKEQAEKAAALKQQLAETAKAEAAKVEAAKKQREDAEREAALKQKQAEEAARIAALKPTEIVKAPSPASLPPAAANTGAGLDQGLQLIKAGQYSAAVNALKPLAQANPKDVPTQMALGIALFEGAEKPDSYDRAGTQAALSVFNDIVQSNEQNAQAFMYAGHCNGRLDHDQEKMQYFRKGISLAKAKVGWEIRWYMGNRNLKEKDFANAASLLLEAEAALLPGTKEPRLLRDLAYAFHGAKQDDEAIKRVNALWELGYTPDANLVAELKKVSPNAVKVPDNAVAQNAPAIPAVADTRLDVPTPGGRDTTNTPIDRSRIVATAPALPAIPDVPNPAQTAQNKLPLPTENAIKSAPQVAVPNTPAAVTPGAKSIEPRKQSTVSDLDNMTPSTIPTTERTRKNSTSRDVLKERPKKELPRVPESFEAALDTGKRALANGHRVMLKIEEEAKKGDDDAKLRIEALRNEASDAWDEAEAMLRGAWEMKPDDLGVKAQFEELAKQVGVVALVKSPLLISKPNGLVVLNAEPSIVYPEGKTMYYAWQQVDGKELSLRREDLDKKTVGLRIKIPGTYKFELVVSDGSRGGNPVSVIVEVR